MVNFFLYNYCRWARWTEILEQGQFKRGWREQDIEECSRIIVSKTDKFTITYNQSDSLRDDCYANIEETLGFR